MQFTVQWKGVPEAANDLEGMGQRAANARPAFEQVVDLILEGEKSLWRRNGGGGKKKWPPNTKSTLAHKIAANLDPRPGRATGDLERSLTVKGAAHQVIKYDQWKVTFGTSLWYAHFSQLAKDADRKRVVLDIPAKEKKSIRAVILDHIVNGG